MGFFLRWLLTIFTGHYLARQRDFYSQINYAIDFLRNTLTFKISYHVAAFIWERFFSIILLMKFLSSFLGPSASINGENCICIVFDLFVVRSCLELFSYVICIPGRFTESTSFLTEVNISLIVLKTMGSFSLRSAVIIASVFATIYAGKRFGSIVGVEGESA